MIERLLSFHFGAPGWLGLLLLVPVLVFLQGREGRGAAIPYSSLNILKTLGTRPRTSYRQWLRRLGWIAPVLLVLALARPRIEQGDTGDRKEGIDIVLCIDLSGSMEAEDFVYQGKKIARSKALKLALDEFVTNRPNDRFGIIGFASGTFLVSPLTTDGNWITTMLGVVKADMHGTAIGEGIAASVELLESAKGKSRVVVVATDGGNNAGRAPKDGAELARAKGVRVHTLRIGPLQTVSAESAVKDVMSAVAETTGGLYFQAADLNSLMDVYRQIDRMEKSRFEEKRYRLFDELYPWFAVPAALALLVGWIANHTRWARLP